METTDIIICPNCNTKNPTLFYRMNQVPVHSVLLFRNRQEAINYPRKDIQLGFCQNCCFIFNTLFEQSIHEYSSQYEETQAFSDFFNQFHENLAKTIIERNNLYNKTIIEIGCGKGEFLNLLCKYGNNRGIGFDPSYVPERNRDQIDKVIFIKDFYSEKYRQFEADYICCKMTLEHISNTYDFIRLLRKSCAQRSNVTVFFQVPDMSKILKEYGFWDIYYEHCSYFTATSLSWLFESAGFDIIHLDNIYGDQYLTIEARPILEKPEIISKPNNWNTGMAYLVDHFSSKVPDIIKKWQQTIDKFIEEGKKIVIWGAGSKGVSFLTTLGITAHVKYAVDINPFKTDTFMAGTGQQIVLPEFLKVYQPGVVIIMNPIYMTEIQHYLKQIDLNPKLMAINSVSSESNGTI